METRSLFFAKLDLELTEMGQPCYRPTIPRCVRQRRPLHWSKPRIVSLAGGVNRSGGVRLLASLIHFEGQSESHVLDYVLKVDWLVWLAVLI